MDPAIAARAVQYLAVAVVAGSSLALVRMPTCRWPSWPIACAALAGALGAAGWLVAQAAQIADASATLSIGLETGFGRAALLRIGLLLLAFGLALRRDADWRAVAALGALAAATFAWTGHGNADDGVAGVLHLAADIAHLLAAAAWLGALPVLLSVALRRLDGDTAAALRDFSRVGPALVAVVALTGIVNSWLLIGPAAVLQPLETPYGRLLAAKLGLFGLMLWLAAMNRWMLTPSLGDRSDARRWTVVSLSLETLAGAGVLALVAWMGTLPPPAHG